MKSFDAIWNRARADLIHRTAHGDEDVFLWEHSSRVARTALRIGQLSIVQKQSPDMDAILAGALYHDAGWIARLHEKEITSIEVLSRPTNMAHKEQGAQMLIAACQELLTSDSLKRAAEGIRGMFDRNTDRIEAQVLTEAENLEEFSLTALWPVIRRGAIEGKGVQAVIDNWERRKEYQFWSARLKDGFRFASVRALAKKRLAQLERLMEDLKEQHTGEDTNALHAPAAGERSAT